MGMMGASLALALKKSDRCHGKVLGAVRSERSAAYIRQMELCDEVFVLPEVDLARAHYEKLPEPSLIVIGMPVGAATNFVRSLKGVQHLITDMSSTRRAIEDAAAGVRFVGSHPICGSEDAGPQAARVDLFVHRLCILTPQAGSANDDIKAVEDFWQKLEMNVIRMDPAIHDRVLAYLSHAPHVLSGMIAQWGFSSSVADAVRKSPVPLSGGGFRDMVRIAGSNPEMWLDIIRTNGDQIKQVLEEFRDQTNELLANWDSRSGDQWTAWLKEARRRRNLLCGYPEEL